MRNKNLGKEGLDKLTKFNGLVIGYCEYITGCNQYLILPEAKENVYQDGQWIDEKRIEFGDMVTEFEADDNGCDIPPNKK